MLNYIVKNYKWGPSWWRKDRKGNKKCLQGLKLKSLLMKVKEESEKAGIKHNIQKMKIMASSSICCCCCCCKLLQLCRQQPSRLPRPWYSPGKNTGVGCHFLLQCMKVKSESEVTQSCPTLRDPRDCSPPGSSIHGILQARVLEWGAIAFSMDYKNIKDTHTQS